MKAIEIIFITFFILFTSCDFTKNIKNSKKEDANEETNTSDIIIKQKKNKEGRVVTEIPYRGDLKHGMAKHFYPNGNVSMEIPYVNNIKHGISKYYYTDGKIYRETPYVNGNINGIRRKYYENGKLMSETPYRNNLLMPGLKEWTKEGKLLKQYPNIVFKEIDKLAFEGKIVIQVRFSDNSKNVEFYRKYISESKKDTSRIPLLVENGITEIDFYIPKGKMLTEKVEIIGIKNTRRRNKYVTEATYNLAVENRLF